MTYLQYLRIDNNCLNGLSDFGKRLETNGELKKIEIPEGVVKIRNYAFCGCRKIESIKMPDSVEIIGKGAFLGCSALNEIKISKKLELICEDAFKNCKNLNNIQLPDSLEVIDKEAFKGCKNVTSIHIPRKLKYIDISSLDNCLNLKEITVDDNNSCFSSQNNVLFNTDKTVLLFCPQKNDIGDYKIPNCVVEIYDCAFFSCLKLTNINFPDSVTTIGTQAFSCCDGLERITIPKNVTFIGNRAFEYCSNLRSVTIKNTVPPKWKDSFFNTNILTIYVPQSAVDAYKAADGWSQYADIIVGDEE